MYTAISIDVFIAAYSGCLGGMRANRGVSQNTNPAHYSHMCLVALAFAEAFDTEYASILPNELQLEEIESICSEQMNGKQPGGVPPTTAAFWVKPVDAIIALLSESDSTFAANVTNPIPIPTPVSSVVLTIATVVGLTNSLKSTIPTTAVSAIVEGYTAIADGGSAGVYFWYPGYAGAANDGTIVRPTGALLGAWFAVYSGPINVLWFGAVGNGVADDLAPVTAAIAAIPTTGGGLYFPGGQNAPFITVDRTYLLSDQVNTTGYTNLKMYSDSGAKIQLTKDKHGFDFNTCTGLEIHGLQFLGTIQTDGGDPGGGNANQTAIAFAVCSDVDIHDCIFQNLGGYGTFIANDNTRVNVHHNNFVETMAGCQTGGEAVVNDQLTICDNIFKGFIPTGGAGTLGSDDQIALLGTVGHAVVARNLIDKRAVDAGSRAKAQAQCIDISTASVSVSEIICSQNICLNSRSTTPAQGRAAILVAIVTAGTYTNVEVTDNEIREANEGINVRFDAAGNANKLLISRNQISSIVTAGVGRVVDPNGISVVNGGAGTIKTVIVEDNQIDAVGGFGIVWDNLASIFVRGNTVDGAAGTNSIQGTTTTDAEIAGNVVLNSTGVGIITSDVHHVRCVNNSIVAPGNDGITIAGAEDCVVANNEVRDTAANGIRVNDCDFSTVQGNTASGCAANGFAYGTAFDTLFSGNVSYNNTGAGLLLAGTASRGIFTANRYSGNGTPVSDTSTTSTNDFTNDPDWTPEGLPADTPVVSDWDPETGATVVAGLVTALADSVSAHNMTDGGAGAAGQPTYVANGPGGKHYMLFDGVANELGTALILGLAAQPYTMMMVWAHFNDTIANVSDVLWSDSGGTALIVQTAVPQITDFAGGAFNIPQTPNNVALGGFGGSYWAQNGATSKMFNNGQLLATGNPGAGGLDMMNFGAYTQVNVAATRFMHCAIARGILASGVLSPMSRANMNAYFQRTYDLPPAN